MEIRIDGSRATSENWLFAHQLPSSDLPVLSDAELRTAERLGIAAEDYARSRYAADLTDAELGKRAEALAKWVGRWLARFAPQWTVQEVFFKTIEGKLRLTVTGDGGARQLVFVSENLVDDLLDCGSAQASDALARLLRANLDVPLEAEAA